MESVFPRALSQLAELYYFGLLSLCRHNIENWKTDFITGSPGDNEKVYAIVFILGKQVFQEKLSSVGDTCYILP